jgi:hypothetical protein
MARLAGAVLQPVRLNPQDMGLDLEELQRAFSPKTKLIMCVIVFMPVLCSCFLFMFMFIKLEAIISLLDATHFVESKLACSHANAV